VLGHEEGGAWWQDQMVLMKPCFLLPRVGVV
jgi:hypothetical protein